MVFNFNGLTFMPKEGKERCKKTKRNLSFERKLIPKRKPENYAKVFKTDHAGCNILNKHINGRIYETNWIIKSGEYRA